MIIGSATLGATAGLGLWALLADARLVPGRSVVDTVLGRCDLDAPPPPDAEPGKILKASFYSAHRKRSVQYQLIYPPNVAPGVRLPVCVYLHGEGGDASEAEKYGFHRMLAGHVAQGMPPCALFTVDGGDSFWHPRANGDNPLRMVLEEVPVVLRQYGLPVDKLALMGLAAGGYGALLVGSEAPKQFVAVTAVSPTVFRSFEESQDLFPNAFDSADDWHQYGDLRPRADAFKNLPLRIDCGGSDTYEPNLRRLQEQLPPDSVFFNKGCHDQDFWRSAAPAAILAVGNRLTPPPAPAS